MTLPTPKNHFAARWALIVIGLLAGHVLLMLWATVKAVGDPNFVLIPNYYEKAVNWDKDQARQRASDALGWKVALEVGDGRDALNRRRVLVRLTDSNGAPVAVSSIKVDGFHDADASHPFSAVGRAESPGTFAVDLPIERAGFHQFSVEARLESLEYVEQWRQHIAAPAKVGRR